jgi:hypothetical protein
MAITRIDHLQVNRLDVQQTTVAGGNTFVDLANAATDEKAKVSSNDTTPGFLNGKLVAGTNVTLTENNNGGNETLTISAAAAPVTSVNGLTGPVTLTAASVGAAATVHTHAASDVTSGVFATARLASSGTASASTYLRGDQTWATVAGGGGTTGFTPTQNVAAPNATINASRLLVDVATSSGDAVLQPKGFGAVMAQLPDSTDVGGNKRGSYAVDWQMHRATAAQVATGNYSVVLGGSSNTASQDYSVVGGRQNTVTGYSAIASGYSNETQNTYCFIGSGQNNTAGGQYSVITGGQSSTASGEYSTIIGGRNNVASNSYAIAGGRNSTAQEYASIALGEYVYVNGSNSVGIGKNVYIDSSESYGIGSSINAAGAVQGVFIGKAITSNTNIGACVIGSQYSNVGSGNHNTIVGGYNHTMSVTNPSYATIIGGENNIANGSYSIAMGEGALAPVNGSRAYASGYFSNQGDAQLVELLVRKNTNDGTAQELCAGTSASNANTLIVEIDTTVSFDILVTARNAATNGESAGWTIRGVIANDGGTVAFVGTPVVTSIGANAGASTWLIAVNADNTNKRLAVNATGQVGKSIGWVAHIRSTQLNR